MLIVFLVALAYFWFYSRHHLVADAPEEEFEAIERAESVRDRARQLGSPFLEAWAVYIIGTIVIDEPELVYMHMVRNLYALAGLKRLTGQCWSRMRRLCAR